MKKPTKNPSPYIFDPPAEPQVDLDYPNPLPIENDVLNNRPGDQIFQGVKDNVSLVKEKSKEFKKRLTDIILTDMYLDLALSGAIDDAGATAEYLAQELGIEKPMFTGDSLLVDFSRISKFKTSMALGQLLALSDAEMSCVMQEEACRLWGNGKKQEVVKESKRETKETNVLKLPEEVVNILRSLKKA